MSDRAVRIAGIDGCKAGWFVVSANAALDDVMYFVAENFAGAIKQLGHTTFVGVDIPIGVPDAGPRECDSLARRLLSPRRASSVFPAPIRPILGMRDYKAACGLRESIDGKRISVQTFNILRKIDEVDRYMRRNSNARFFEVHPELAFAALDSGEPMMFAKRSREGRGERLALLKMIFDGEDLAAASSAYPSSQVAKDDVLDAFAVLATVARIAVGHGQRVPERPAHDSAGLDMAIWF